MPQFSREHLENLAIRALHGRKKQITDYNIDYLVHYILKAINVYKPEIGNIHGFISTYLQYGIGSMIREQNKHKKEVPFSVLLDDKIEAKKFDPTAKAIRPEQSELFSHIQARKMLTPKQESVIYRMFFMRERAEDIAESMGISKSAVYYIQERALAKLRCLKSELL